MNIRDSIDILINSLYKENLILNGFSAVEYNNKYSNPNLPPHYDGDDNDLIFSIQLSSNVSWGVGVDCELYRLKDNSAVIFHPNVNAHWRPKKEFKDGEYVRMMFVRFYKATGRTDYSHMRYGSKDPIFDKVNEFRDSF
jgi:hypothetical protein